MAAAQANLDFGWPAFIEERLPPLETFPGFLQNVVRAWPLEGHYAQLAKSFRSQKLRAALSFQVGIMCVSVVFLCGDGVV